MVDFAINGVNSLDSYQVVPQKVAFGSARNDFVSNSKKDLERSPEDDLFVKNDILNRSDSEKQAIIKKARNKATFWSTGGPVGIALLYYSLRSDEKIAKKYGLDVENDKDLIKQIRKTQVKWSIPSIVGLGPLAWIVSLTSSADKIEV